MSVLSLFPFGLGKGVRKGVSVEDIYKKGLMKSQVVTGPGRWMSDGQISAEAGVWAEMNSGAR